MSLTVAEIKADYRAIFNERGETVTVRRYTGAGTRRPRFDVDVMAVVTSFSERVSMVGHAEMILVGTIVEGDLRVLVLADDLTDAQIALPITTADKVVVRGREFQIIAADDATFRVAGVLIAYGLQARG